VDLDPSAGGTRQILDATHGREILISPNSRCSPIMLYQIPRQSIARGMSVVKRVQLSETQLRLVEED
jgi:hypothetical protein